MRKKYRVRRSEITAEILRHDLDYDPATGEFIWKMGREGVRMGKACGTINRYGYSVISFRGNIFHAHRLAWLYFYGENVVGRITHINGNRADNRISNLAAERVSGGHANSDPRKTILTAPAK